MTFVMGVLLGTCVSLLSIMFFNLINSKPEDCLDQKIYDIEIDSGRLWQKAKIKFIRRHTEDETQQE